MTSVTADNSDVTDGPVLCLINKRIRKLRKKLNRIGEVEESIAQGKSKINDKELQDLLASKPSILAAVDELEKFRQPLSVAVDEEIKESNETAKHEVVDDLLSLIYFGSMFDVKSHNDFSSIMQTRTGERDSFFIFDYMKDDAVMLDKTDLDYISHMSELLISRPADSSFSHHNALKKCIEHAKLWIDKSEQPISLNSDVTYASLKDKLTRIIGSDYSKMKPGKMKTRAHVAAEAAENHAFHVPVKNGVAQHEQKVLIDTCISWPNSASEVSLAGSFDGWTTQRKMKRSEMGGFSLSLKLYPGRYEVKFIVDGVWKVDPLRTIVNNDGYENNVLTVLCP